MPKGPIRLALAEFKSQSIYGALNLLPPRTRLGVQYWRTYHRALDLRAPRLFSEKVQLLKLNPWLARQAHWADKVDAKAHAARILGDEWIIPTLWAGPQLPPRAERTWPTPFFIKASHGSGWNHYVPNEAARDWAVIERHCDHWLSTPWPRHLMETQYDFMQRRVLVEPRIGTGEALPIDYKFWVFNGRVEYISLTFDRLGTPSVMFLDRAWRRIEISDKRLTQATVVPERTSNYDRMLEAAERLGGHFPFARVDLYDLPDGPKFGEVTLTPASGLERGHPPDELDPIMGDMLDLAKYADPAPR